MSQEDVTEGVDNIFLKGTTTQVFDAWAGSQLQLSRFGPMEVPAFLDDIFVEHWQVVELGTLQGENFLYDFAPAVEVAF